MSRPLICPCLKTDIRRSRSHRSTPRSLFTRSCFISPTKQMNQHQSLDFIVSFSISLHMHVCCFVSTSEAAARHGTIIPWNHSSQRFTRLLNTRISPLVQTGRIHALEHNNLSSAKEETIDRLMSDSLLRQLNGLLPPGGVAISSRRIIRSFRC
jgi:hypothetical protein